MDVRIAEVYRSFEGEGVFVGTSTLFVRLAGCPLRCFYCDTPDFIPLGSGKKYSIKVASELIDEALGENVFKVNFTGGEPLWQSEAVAALARHVQSKGILTYLESSCYDTGRFSQVLPYIDICKIEFKLKDAKALSLARHKRLIASEMGCLKAALAAGKKTYIKIVVTRKSEIAELEAIAATAAAITGSERLEGFVLQPAWGVDQPSAEHLTALCAAVSPYHRQVRVIPQTHKILDIR
ncbi:MAG: 7-carboxy-7-deazaguanine synthase QueE [Elusimicrobiota bacterium]